MFDELANTCGRHSSNSDPIYGRWLVVYGSKDEVNPMHSWCPNGDGAVAPDNTPFCLLALGVNKFCEHSSISSLRFWPRLVVDVELGVPTLHLSQFVEYRYLS